MRVLLLFSAAVGMTTVWLLAFSSFPGPSTIFAITLTVWGLVRWSHHETEPDNEPEPEPVCYADYDRIDRSYRNKKWTPIVN